MDEIGNVAAALVAFREEKPVKHKDPKGADRGPLEVASVRPRERREGKREAWNAELLTLNF